MRKFDRVDVTLYRIYKKILEATNDDEINEGIKEAKYYLKKGIITSPRDEILKNLINNVSRNLEMSEEEKDYSLNDLFRVAQLAKEKWRNESSASEIVKVFPLSFFMTPGSNLIYPPVIIIGFDNTLRFLICQYIAKSSGNSYYTMCDSVTKEEVINEDIFKYIGTVTTINEKKVYVIPATFLLKTDIYSIEFINFLTKEINEYLVNNPDYIKKIFDSALKLQSPRLVRMQIKKYRW